MTRPIWEFEITLPRHAFSARDASRAGDVWRCCQEVAVEASARAGWPPQRYREAGTAFVVRSMTTQHHREAVYGERLQARTWVSRFRRGTLSTREVRLVGQQGMVTTATQEWVHVSAGLQPTRASEALAICFPPHDPADGRDRSAELPAFEPRKGSIRRFTFRPWFTWMDPLNHVNHPAYIDFCDEGLSRTMADKGMDPLGLEPVAESATFFAGVDASDDVTVETEPIGVTREQHLVCEHRVFNRGGKLCTKATTVRTNAFGDGERFLRTLLT